MQKILHRSNQTIELIDSNNYVFWAEQLCFLTLIITLFEPFVYVTSNVSHGAEHLRIRISTVVVTVRVYVV